MRRKITRYPHIRSGPSLSRRFNNNGGNTLLPHGKLRLTAYILVFLLASLAAFRLNVGFAHAQNIIQVSESAQAQKKPKIPLATAEQARLTQNHTVRVRVFYYPPFMIASGGEAKGISFDNLRIIAERTGINFAFIKETMTFDDQIGQSIGSIAHYKECFGRGKCHAHN